jgi:pimeloyl-ACP methyl ester carboxylesterase
MPHATKGNGPYLVTGTALTEPWWALRPRRPGVYPGICLMHGAGGEEQWASDYWNPPPAKVLKKIVSMGYVAISPDGRTALSANGAHTWGHDDSTSTYRTAVDYARTNLGMAPGPIILMGGSMGCISAFNYKRRWPDEVVGIFLAPGAFNVDGYHYTGNNSVIGKFQVEIDAAFGGAAGWAAAKATHDPYLFVGNPSDWGPVMVHHCDDDVVSPKAYVDTMAARVGADYTTYPTGDHSGGYSQMNIDDVKSWFRETLTPGVPG